MQHILWMVQEKLPELPKSERKIGQLILEDPLRVIQMSAAQLALEADSSPAAVIRFCRSVGIKGFTELKLQLSAMSNQFQEELYTDILPDEELGQIKKKLLANTTYVLEKTNTALNDEQVELAAEWLVHSPVIFVYGLGASYIVAMDINQKFTRLGKQVFCSQDQHSLAASMALAGSNSVYIGISNSGEKKEGLVLMELANELGLRTISLTRKKTNALSGLAQLALRTADAQEAPLRSAATISLLNQLYAVDIIFYRFLTKRYTEHIAHLEHSRQAIAQLSNHYNK